MTGNGLPPRRGAALPPRETNTDNTKSVEQVIQEAPLKTSTPEQTNPVQKETFIQPDNQRLTVNQLWSLTKKKSFNFPLIIQDKLTCVLEHRKLTNVPVLGQKQIDETFLVLELLNAGLDQELIKMGLDPNKP